MMEKMKIIDAHVHAVEQIAGLCRRGELRGVGGGRARWANGEEMTLIPEGCGDRDFTGEAILRLLDAHGVEKAVLLQGSMYGFQNLYTAQLCRKYPVRFAGAGTVDPFMRDWESVLGHLFDGEGLRILKFEVSSGGGLMGYHPPFALDGPAMEGPLAFAAERGATVAFDIGDCTMESYQPQALRRIALRYPRMKLVVCHLLAPLPGREEQLKRDLSLLSLPNVWFDLAALPIIPQMQPYPFAGALRAVAAAREIVGAEKLIWGTDSPLGAALVPYGEHIRYLKESGVFTGRELSLVFYQNAQAVYFGG